MAKHLCKLVSRGRKIELYCLMFSFCFFVAGEIKDEYIGLYNGSACCDSLYDDVIECTKNALVVHPECNTLMSPNNSVA